MSATNRALLSLVEVVLALVGVFALSVAVAVAGFAVAAWWTGFEPLAGVGDPRFESDEFLLERSAPHAPSPETLLELAEEERFAKRVELIDRGEEVWLLAVGAPPGATREFLVRNGYRITRVTLESTFRFEEILDAASDVTDLHPGAFGYVLGVQTIVMLLAGAALQRWRVGSGGSGRDRGSAAFGRAVAVGLAIGIAGLAVSFALDRVQAWIGFPVQEQAWVAELIRPGSSALALLPLLVLAVPLAEELFFRGYVFALLASRVGVTSGCVVSAGLFALVHFNPTAMAVYVAYGLILALGYRMTGRLATPVTAHMLINGVSLALVLLLGA